MDATLRPGHGSALSRTFAALITLAVAGSFAPAARAASPVPLGTADSFALLAGSTITNTGPTTVNGDIGVCCTGLAMTGFGSLTQPRGAQYAGPGTAAQSAQAALQAAYDDIASRAPDFTVPVELSNTPATALVPGVYDSGVGGGGAFGITNALYLDFQGNPNAVFIFRSDTLVTGANSSVNIVNAGGPASSCNVYWRLTNPTQSATFGTNTAFRGTTLALGQQTLNTGATVDGRILTRDSKQVTLDSNTITQSACAVVPAAGGGTPAPTGTPAPASPAAPPAAAPPAAAPTPTPVAPAPVVAAPPAGSAPAAPVAGSSVAIAGPKAPVKGAFSVSVTGADIAKVVFVVNGKPLKTVTARPGHPTITAVINPHGGRLVRVVARVTYKPTSGKPPVTVRRYFSRPPRAGGPPRFTGRRV